MPRPASRPPWVTCALGYSTIDTNKLDALKAGQGATGQTISSRGIGCAEGDRKWPGAFSASTASPAIKEVSFDDHLACRHRCDKNREPDHFLHPATRAQNIARPCKRERLRCTLNSDNYHGERRTKILREVRLKVGSGPSAGKDFSPRSFSRARRSGNPNSQVANIRKLWAGYTPALPRKG